MFARYGHAPLVYAMHFDSTLHHRSFEKMFILYWLIDYFEQCTTKTSVFLIDLGMESNSPVQKVAIPSTAPGASSVLMCSLFFLQRFSEVQRRS